MSGRFSLRRAPSPPPATPVLAPQAAAPSIASPSIVPPAAPEPAEPAANPLLSSKLLDAKVRLHRKLIEEINLSALDKLPEEEVRSQVQGLVTQYVLAERLALNQQELADFVSEI